MSDRKHTGSTTGYTGKELKFSFGSSTDFYKFLSNPLTYQKAVLFETYALNSLPYNINYKTPASSKSPQTKTSDEVNVGVGALTGGAKREIGPGSIVDSLSLSAGTPIFGNITPRASVGATLYSSESYGTDGLVHVASEFGVKTTLLASVQNT